MKSLTLSLLVSFFSLSTLARASKPTLIPNLEVISYALSSPEVQKVLGNESITKISVSQENVSTTWTYTISVETLRHGMGMKGPSTAPCYASIVVRSIGGVAGTTTSVLNVKMVCAQNY